jgi:flavin-dependent dehydrogenase
VVLVGDAGGYVDALTGEGLAVGLAQAAVAVQALARDRPGDYPRLARRVSWRSTALTAALLYATHVPPVRSALVPAAVRFPGLFQLAVDELAATAARPSSD